MQSRPGWARPTAGSRGLSARIANTDRTRRDAYALRYASYLSGGHIEPNASKLFRDRFDDMPTATTVVVYAAGDVAVGSVRMCLLRRDDAMTSPARTTYPAEVDGILAASDPDRRSENCIEINRLVRSPAASDDQGLVFALIRLAGKLGSDAGFSTALNCVRSNHVRFYRRMNFVEAGPPRPYPGLTCEMTLMQLPHDRWRDACRDFRLVCPTMGLPTMGDDWDDRWVRLAKERTTDGATA